MVAVSLEDVHIIPNPLLDEYREKCRSKAECEGHEPKRINTDISCRWGEGRKRRGWGRRDGNLWGNGSDLLGDLRKDRGMLLEVVHHLVCGIDLQVLFAIKNERRQRSREQTSL